MLEALSFTNLAGLALALASPLLLLAYLKRRPRKQLTVSSALILRQLPQTITLKKRLQLPPRFFFELALLLLIALALASPVLKEPAEQVAVLLDNSLSMSMREGDKSRQELAAAAVDVPKASLYLSSPQLRRVSDSAFSKSALRKEIIKAPISLTPDRIEVSAKRLSESGKYSKIIILSDREAEIQTTEGKAGNSTEIVSIEIGGPHKNLYISSLLSDRDEALVARVGSNGLPQKDVKIRFSMRGITESSFRDIGIEEITIPADEDKEVRFPISSLEADSIYQASIVDEDSLAVDNKSWLSTAQSSGTSILLVSTEADDQGLGRIPNLDVRKLEPSEAAKLTREELRNFATIIYQYSAPIEAPPVPSLTIAPPSGNSFFPTKSESRSPQVTSWEADHPLTSYLKVPLLKPTAAVTLSPPLWAQSVINTEEGSILAAGEINGVRHAAVGMGLLPYEGRKTPAPTVLTLNLLSWLNNSSNLGARLSTGSTYRLPEKGIVTMPDGSTIPVSDEPPFIDLPQPGVYLVETTSERFVLTASAFYPEEARETAAYKLPSVISWQNKSSPEDQPLWPYILLAVILALVVDAALYKGAAHAT